MLALLGNQGPEVRVFIKQDVEASLKNMGLLTRIAKVATDAAAVADVALQGAGKP